jgi:FixJ family two-component response regulator
MAAHERLLPDRRHTPRGGRRPEDRGGFTPLIFLIDSDLERRELCSMILLQMRFAVAPFTTAASAMRAIESLAPDAIVVSPSELDAVSHSVPVRRSGRNIPVVPLHTRGEVLVGALRVAFRSTAEPAA